MHLSVEALSARARRLARSEDLWGTTWEPAARVLLGAVEAEAGLLPNRAEATAVEMVDHLVTRARIATKLRERPDILELDVPSPIVISGLPRSGTTLLHNLLARAPGMRGYRLWELRAPATPGEAPMDWSRRQVELTQGMLDRLYTAQPRFKTIHPLAPGDPDECNWLLRRSFATPVYAWTFRVPSYYRWLRTADLTGVYAEHKAQLQLLRWRSPGGVPILKDPGHLWALDSLFATYPEAIVVRLHRDLASCVPSLASLCHALWTTGSEHDDPAEVGREALAMARDALEDERQARQAHAGRFLDVAYTELVADPVGTVRRILTSLGRRLDADGEARLRAWMGAQHKAPAHRYDLADFGLDAADVASVGGYA
ncbi:MAG: sulfotransferase [Myxococcota bacterium]